MNDITYKKLFLIKFYINIIKDLIYNINTYLYANKRYKDLIKTIEFYILLDNLVNFLYNIPYEFSYNSITFNENFNDIEITEDTFNKYLSTKDTTIIYYNKFYIYNNVTRYIVKYGTILSSMNITDNKEYIKFDICIDLNYNGNDKFYITIFGSNISYNSNKKDINNDKDYIIYDIVPTNSTLEEFKDYIIEYLKTFFKDSIMLAQNLNSLNLSIDDINYFINDIEKNINNIDELKLLQKKIKYFILLLYYNKKFIDLITCIEFYKLLEQLFIKFNTHNTENINYNKITSFYMYVYFPKKVVEKFKNKNIEYFTLLNEQVIPYNLLLNIEYNSIIYNYKQKLILQEPKENILIDIYERRLKTIYNISENYKEKRLYILYICTYIKLKLEIIINSLYTTLLDIKETDIDTIVNFVIKKLSKLFDIKIINNFYIIFYINIIKDLIYNINSYLYANKRYKDLIITIEFYILLNELLNILYDNSNKLSYYSITFNKKFIENDNINEEIFNKYLSTKDKTIIYYNSFISKEIISINIINNIIIISNDISINNDDNITLNKTIKLYESITDIYTSTNTHNKLEMFKTFIHNYLINIFTNTIILAQNLNNLNLSISDIEIFINDIQDNMISKISNINKQQLLKQKIKFFISLLYYNKKFIDVIKCIEFYKLLENLFNYSNTDNNTEIDYNIIDNFNMYVYFSKEAAEQFKNENIIYFTLLNGEIMPYNSLLKIINTVKLDLNINGGNISKYKSTGNKITILYKKKKYTRVIYINNRKKYIKINKVFILLSKLKKI